MFHIWKLIKISEESEIPPPPIWPIVQLLIKSCWNGQQKDPWAIEQKSSDVTFMFHPVGPN